MKQDNTNSTAYQAENMNIYNSVQPRNKSIIAQVVNILSSIIPSNRVLNYKRTIPAEVKTKMDHNNLTKSRYIIESYKNNVIDLNNAYNTLEEERPGNKDKLIRNIKNLYEYELSQIDFEKNGIKAIRENSDKILENCINELQKQVLESSNLNAYNEDVYFAVNLIIADAFIECILLENPSDRK